MPAAKLVANGDCFSIVSDYLGTPMQAYDKQGNKVWEQELDIYGRQRKRPSAFIPFKYQGQYEDAETGLYYNRFRYYDPKGGSYISQDPIGLLGDNPTLYGYISEPNSIVDVFGLQGTGVPFQVGTHEDLIKINAGTGLDSHHAGQKAIMGNLVANYDEMKAPAILVPTVGHTRTKDGVGIVSRRKVNPKTGNPFTSARELLARDIRELRRVYGDEVSNKQLQKLIDLNKSMYPEMRKQRPKKSSH